MEIIIISTIKAHDVFWGKKDVAVDKLNGFLQNKGVKELFDYVLMLV